MPRSEPKSELKDGPEPEPGPEYDGHSHTGPSSESGFGEPTAEPENWPEPGPLWEEAYKTWKWAWELHVYLYATSFLAIGLYAGCYVVFNVYDGLQGKYLSVSLNIMVTIFGFTRAFVMFLDPYQQGNIIQHAAVMRVIWSIGGPCLTASDCLMILALLETTKISIAPPKLQQASVNVVIIFLHFTLVIATDCVVSDYVEAKAMLLFCQIFFIVWGGVLGTANIILGYKLDKLLFSHKTPKEKADKMYIDLIYASGAANYFLCGIVAYSAIGVFGVYSNVLHVDAWPWWALQTLSRFSEALACVLIFTVSAKRTQAKDAYAQVMGSVNCCQSGPITAEGRWSNRSLKKLKKLFKSNNKTSKGDVDNGSQVSLFTALREMALVQVTGDEWAGTNPTPWLTRRGECWVKTKTGCSVIHLPGASYGCPTFQPAEFSCVEDSHDNLKHQKEYLELEVKHVRRRSMFSALQEAKASNIIFAFQEKTTDSFDETEETIDSDPQMDNDPKTAWTVATLPNQTTETTFFNDGKGNEKK